MFKSSLAVFTNLKKWRVLWQNDTSPFLKIFLFHFTSSLHFSRLIPGRGRRSGSVVSRRFCRLHLLAPPVVPACPGPQDRAISLWVCLLVAFRGSPYPSLVWGCFLVPYGAHAQTIWACSPSFPFHTPYPQLFPDILTLHFVFHCHPLDSSQHSHFCLFNLLI